MTIEKNGIATADYVSKDILKDALKSGLQCSNVNIQKITFTKASAADDNYTSDILRVLVTYSLDKDAPKEISLIAKVVITQTDDRQILEDLKVHDKEVNMYQNIIPRLEDLLRNQIKLGPKCFHATNDPINIIVFEDLKTRGYIVADRSKGLDEAHSRLVLEKIAKFHAASMILAKETPELMAPFDQGMFNEHTINSKIMKTFFLDNLIHIIGIVETWQGYECIAKKLKRIVPNFFDKCVETAKPKEGDLRVLNHGDLWVNNFMFKYNNKEPCDVALLDLQVAFYSGLGIDINYFLNTSVQLDVLKTRRYELLRFYYNNLKSALEELKYSPIPSWEDVKNEIRSKEFYGFVSFEAVLPWISMDKDASKDNSLENLGNDEFAKEKRDIIFSSERVIETMKYALDRFDELGTFD